MLARLIDLKLDWWRRASLKCLGKTILTFSLVAKMAFVQLFLSIEAIRHWPLFQLDIKNDFLHDDLEEVYVEQPLGFVALGVSSTVVCWLCRSLCGLE